MPCKITELRIRPGRPADVPLLQAIERAATGRYAEMPQTRFCLELPVRDDAEHRLARECGLAVVIDLEGVPVGFALAMPKDGCAHLLEVAVAPRLQGRGYGTRLIATAEAWAPDSGFTEITLTTFRDVRWNASFFGNLGYELIEIGSDRPELAGVIADERRSWFHAAPRIVRRKAFDRRK